MLLPAVNSQKASCAPFSLMLFFLCFFSLGCQVNPSRRDLQRRRTGPEKLELRAQRILNKCTHGCLVVCCCFAPYFVVCFFFPLSPPHCIHALLMGLCLARRTNASTAPSDTRTDGSQRIDSYLSLEAHAGCTIVGERTRTLRERQAVGDVRTPQPHDKDWIEGFAERMQTPFEPRFQSERLKNEPGNWLGKKCSYGQGFLLLLC